MGCVDDLNLAAPSTFKHSLGPCCSILKVNKPERRVVFFVAVLNKGVYTLRICFLVFNNEGACFIDMLAI